MFEARAKRCIGVLEYIFMFSNVTYHPIKIYQNTVEVSQTVDIAHIKCDLIIDMETEPSLHVWLRWIFVFWCEHRKKHGSTQRRGQAVSVIICCFE